MEIEKVTELPTAGTLALGGLDAAFLYLESPTTPLHVGMVAVLEPPADLTVAPIDRLRALLLERMVRMPLLRQRLNYPLGGLLPPVWVDDPAFDLDNHVIATPVLAELTTASISAVAADLLRHQLPRDRPLWELYVLEASDDSRIAVVAKLHHALLDGVAGLELLAELVDLTPDAVPAPSVTPPATTGGQPVAASLTALLRSQTRMLNRVTTELRNARTPREDEPISPTGSLRAIVTGAPSTSMTSRIGPRRAVEMTSLPMDELIEVRKELGGTLNDVVLAVCGGALRGYFGPDELPAESLVAAVPVSLRTGDGDEGRGNRVSMMLVSLATEVDDPWQRLDAISSSSRQAKADHARLPAASLLTDLLGTVSPSLGTRAGGLLGRALGRGWPPLPCNVVISNVPGPPFTTFMRGMEVASIHPLGPIVDGVPLNITVLSHGDRLEVGITACPVAVPGHGRLPGLLRTVLDELLASARA